MSSLKMSLISESKSSRSYSRGQNIIFAILFLPLVTSVWGGKEGEGVEGRRRGGGGIPEGREGGMGSGGGRWGAHGRILRKLYEL